MARESSTNWEERYRKPGYRCGSEPVEFLAEHLAELPAGRALDLAMGEGRNAVLLARDGWEVTGIDRSPTAIKKARARAQQAGLVLVGIEADLERFPLPEGQFDVVLCFYYLDRELFPAMERALRPGGALVMETYTTDQLNFSQGPRREEHLLEPNELYQAFRHLRVAYYREVTRRDRAVASLLAFKG